MIENGYKYHSLIIEVKQNSGGYEDERNEQREEKPSLEYCRGAEEEDVVKTYKERCRREGKRPQLLLLGQMQYSIKNCN